MNTVTQKLKFHQSLFRSFAAPAMQMRRALTGGGGGSKNIAEIVLKY